VGDAVPRSRAVAADPILSAAYDILLEVGPRRATLTEVARRADISRMTLYRKYQDLPTLLSAVLTAELGEVMAEIIAHSVGGTDRQRAVAMTVDGTRAIAEHPLMVRVLAVDPESLLPLVVSRRGSTARAGEALLVAALNSSTDGSITAPDPVVTARTIVTAASAFIFSANVLAAEDPTGLRYHELARMIEGYLK
jgi:AcrR family transcriptional regulator